MKTLKIYFTLIWISLLIQIPLNAQNCELVDVQAAPNANSEFCCFDLILTNDAGFNLGFPAEIYGVGWNLPVPASMTPATGFQFNYDNGTQRIAASNNLFQVPQGTHNYGTICFDDNLPPSPQQYAVDFNVDGTICTKNFETSCSPCVEIIEDTLVCSNTSGVYTYTFSFTNTFSDDISGFNVISLIPTGLVAAPNLLTFPTVTPGSSFGPITINFTPPVGATSISFELEAICQFGCICTTDPIVLDLPVCEDPCEPTCDFKDVRFRHPTGPITPEYCCSELDVYSECDSLFKYLEIEVNEGFFGYGSTRSNSNWIMSGASSTVKKLIPLPFGSGVPQGWTNDVFEFCLRGIYDPSQVPQEIYLRWYDMNDNLVCIDTFITECEATAPGSCLITDDINVECDENGNYDLTVKVTNIGFTAQHIRMLDWRTNPTGGTITPGLPYTENVTIPTNGMHTLAPIFRINNLSAGDDACFRLALFDDPDTSNYNQCCHTDSLCYELPECPNEECPSTCESITTTYIQHADTFNQYCCVDVSMELECDSMVQYIEIETAGAYHFGYLSVPGSNATAMNISLNKKRIVPLPFAPGFPKGNYPNLFNYCLRGINNSSDIPQKVYLRYYDANDVLICLDSIVTECEVVEEGSCLIVENSEITCDTPGHYNLDLTVRNVGFDATHIRLMNWHTKPAGGTTSPATPITTTGNYPTNSTHTFPTISLHGLSAGDTACFVLSLFDDPDPNTGYNNCCHTDTLCIVMPPCNGSDVPCDSVFTSLDPISEDSCCYTWYLDNRLGALTFSKASIHPLDPSNTISALSTYPGWSVSPNGNGFEANYFGNIPVGLVPVMDVCMSGYVSTPQRYEVQWFALDSASFEEKVVCCKPAETFCEDDELDYPCVTADYYVECDSSGGWQIYIKPANNTHIGGSAPGYPLTHYSLVEQSNTGIGITAPTFMSLSPALQPGNTASSYFGHSISGGQAGDIICYSMGAYQIGDSTDCCHSDSVFCITLPDCCTCENLFDDFDLHTEIDCDVLTVEVCGYEACDSLRIEIGGVDHPYDDSTGIQISLGNGLHEVCAFIERIDVNGVLCMDSICVDIEIDCPLDSSCARLDFPELTHDYVGQAVMTCFSGFKNGTQVDNSAPVLGIYDITNSTTAPIGTNWNAPKSMIPQAVADSVGQVFGIALDKDGCVYVASSTAYGNSATFTSGGFKYGLAGSGGIYQFCPDGAGGWTFNSDFVQSLDNTKSNYIPNTASGLGNICYDYRHNLIFATNFSDGKIYRIAAPGHSSTPGTVLSSFDFAGNDNFPTEVYPVDFIELGERPYAVAYNPYEDAHGRLYFSIWEEDDGRNSLSINNTVYSIELDANGDFVGTPSLEININIPARHSPITDMAFNSSEQLLVTQRSIQQDVGLGTSRYSHRSFVLEYEKDATSNWIHTPAGATKYGVGSGNRSAAGGVDYAYEHLNLTDGALTCDSVVLATADHMGYHLLTSPRTWMYGFQVMRAHDLTNTSSNSILVDADGNILQDPRFAKGKIGDIEVFRMYCCEDDFICDMMEQPTIDTFIEYDCVNSKTIYFNLTIQPVPSRLIVDAGCQDSIIHDGTGTNFPWTPGTDTSMTFCLTMYYYVNGDTCIFEDDFEYIVPVPCRTSGFTPVLQDNFSMFPSVTSSDLFIHSNLNLTNYSYTVSSTHGQIMIQNSALKERLQVHNLNPGLYYFIIRDNDKGAIVARYKFIKF